MIHINILTKFCFFIVTRHPFKVLGKFLLILKGLNKRKFWYIWSKKSRFSLKVIVDASLCRRIRAVATQVRHGPNNF